jgi:hypothetical protein
LGNLPIHPVFTTYFPRTSEGFLSAGDDITVSKYALNVAGNRENQKNLGQLKRRQQKHLP